LGSGFDYDLLCIGSGPAGQRAAVRAAKLGRRVALAIGTGATELIHIGQAVPALGGGLDYFLDAIFNYPTLAECYKVAALDAANKLAF
jgi:pyruvate/2-oxoglutarate dehydrogenase complex dihydrolipoamide dehydrogenase (E3) component